MKIGQKVVFGFTIILIVVSVVTSIGIYTSTQSIKKYEIIENEYIPVTILGSEMNEFINNTLLQIRGYTYTENEVFFSSSLKQLQRLKDSIDKGYNLEKKSKSLSSLKNELKSAESKVAGYINLIKNLSEINNSIVKKRKTTVEAANVFLENAEAFFTKEMNSLNIEIADKQRKERLKIYQQRISLISNVLNIVNNIRITNLTAQTVRNPVLLEVAISKFDKITEDLNKLKILTTDKNKIEMLKNIEESLILYKSTLSSFLDDWIKRENFLSQSEAAGENLISTFKIISENGFNNVKHASIETSDSLRTAKNYLINGIVITIILIFMILYIIKKTVIKPLQSLFEYMEKISKYDISEEIPIKFVKRKDEIGTLAKYFNSFIKKLQVIIIETKELSYDVAEKNKFISMCMDNIINGKESQAYNELMIKLDDGTVHLQNYIDDILNNVRNQTASSEESLAALQQIAASGQESAKNSEFVIAQSHEALEMANAGNANIDNMIEQMKTISSSVENAEGQIDDLLVSSKTIEEITVSINNIAEQTNLLALNAAIEAARAGEAGRGFSVVAEEIRKLAEQTNRETKKIESIVTNIQGQVDEVKTGNDDINKNVLSAINITSKMKEIIANINKIIKGNDHQITRVSKMIHEQAISVEEITNAVDETTNNSNEIEQISITANDIAIKIGDILIKNSEELLVLTDIIDDLNQNIKEFKTEK